jgi:polysaccharide pyruvyl transferase WcaK-like protein
MYSSLRNTLLNRRHPKISEQSKYLLLHAFSRRNSGDGLLVDLTLEALADAGINAAQVEILALDPESFDVFPTVHRAPGEPFAQLTPKLAGAVFELLANQLSSGEVSKLVSRAKGLIAVGGGYLVADSRVRQAGVLLNHLVQLRTAARTPIPSIYLPQSVGPLHGPVGRAVKRHLNNVSLFCARDDITMAEIGGDNIIRCADLAVLKLARTVDMKATHKLQAGAPILVGRDLPNPGDYVERLKKLGQLLSDPLWAVQADVAGDRSDRAFYQRNGMGDDGTLAEMLSTGKGRAVVSVRLHGAIASLIAGRPAVHLAYERKGWGAYEDLGLGEYVHDAREFDPALVADQIARLDQDPSAFWGCIRQAAPKLQSQYEMLVSELRQRLR